MVGEPAVVARHSLEVRLRLVNRPALGGEAGQQHPGPAVSRAGRRPGQLQGPGGVRRRGRRVTGPVLGLGGDAEEIRGEKAGVDPLELGDGVVERGWRPRLSRRSGRRGR